MRGSLIMTHVSKHTREESNVGSDSSLCARVQKGLQ
jgi:hypothetical protein